MRNNTRQTFPLSRRIGVVRALKPVTVRAARITFLLNKDYVYEP